MPHDRQGISFFWIGMAFEGSLAGLAWGLGWILDEPFWNHCSWDVRDAGLGLAASVPMLLLFWACLHIPVGPLARIKRIAEEFIRPLFSGCTVLQLASLSLVAGIGEEFLFRGALQGALGRDWGTGLGMAAASLLFGLVHALTATYVLLAALLGAYLGWLFLLTGNLLPPIMAHAVYDFLALLFLLRARPGPEQPADVQEGVKDLPE